MRNFQSKFDPNTRCDSPLGYVNVSCSSAVDLDPRAYWVISSPLAPHKHLSPTRGDAEEACARLLGDGICVERGSRTYWCSFKIGSLGSGSWFIKEIGWPGRVRSPYASYQDAAKACFRFHGGGSLVETSEEVYWWAVAEIIPPELACE